MDYAETRELVRIRHELRRLLAERPSGADVTARTLIARIETLVAGTPRRPPSCAPSWRAGRSAS